MSPMTFFKRLKLPRQNVSHGAETTLRSVLPCLYQVLIEDLNFYVLCSRPCRALEKVLKNRGFKNINLDGANNSICKGHA